MAHADAEQHWSASAPDVATALGMPDYRDDGSSASDVERHDTPLLHDPAPPARVKKKHGAAKRIYVTASSGEKAMRCASIHDSLETSQRGLRRLLLAAGLCLTFMVVEIIGGYIGNSLAVISDAAHMASDLAGFLISILAILLAQRSATARLTFGYQRVEVIGAVVSVMLIWGLTGYLLYEAVERTQDFLDPDYDGEEVDGMIMTIIGITGLVVNAILAAVLLTGGHGHSHGGMSSHSHSHGGGDHDHDEEDDDEDDDAKCDGASSVAADDDERLLDDDVDEHGHSHSHGQGHSHSHGAATGKKRWCWPWSKSSTVSPHGHSKGKKRKHNINVRAAFIHVVGDFVQGLGVLLAGILIWSSGNNREWWILDPICTFVFAFLVLLTTLTVLRDAIHVLMEGTPTNIKVGDVEDALRGVPRVTDVHELHIWSITPGRSVMAAHLSVQADASFAEVATVMHEAEDVVCRRFDIHHVTIQVEPDVGNLHCQPCTPSAKQRREARDQAMPV